MLRLRLFILLSAGFFGMGAGPAEHSIPWFEMDEHAGARAKAIALCRQDFSYYADPQTAAVCSNAETAENRIYNRRMRGGLRELNTVKWWKDNDSLRASALIACQRRAPYDRDMLQYCDVARQAQNELMRRIRG